MHSLINHKESFSVRSILVRMIRGIRIAFFASALLASVRANETSQWDHETDLLNEGVYQHIMDELLFKTNKMEKWMTYLVLLFVLLIATFNIIASLTMLIIDKKKDVQILSGMGARPPRKFFPSKSMRCVGWRSKSRNTH